MEQKSKRERKNWAQFDALQLGTGWDESDIEKPQILIEDMWADSHPGSLAFYLGYRSRPQSASMKQGGKPAHYHVSDVCDGCTEGHDGMNYVLVSREAIADVVQIHASAIPWDGMILVSSCDKSIPAHMMAAARMDIPAVYIPGGSMRPGPYMSTSGKLGDATLKDKRGEISPRELLDCKLGGCPSLGACQFLGTGFHNAVYGGSAWNVAAGAPH